MSESPMPGTILYKGDIIARAASTAGINEEALKEDPKLMTKAFKAIVDAIQSSIAEGAKVQLTGFGTWESVNRPARKAHDPRTRAEIQVPATVKVRWRPAPGFEGLVAQKAANR